MYLFNSQQDALSVSSNTSFDNKPCLFSLILLCNFCSYVGVINRSQDDINSNKDIIYAVQKERDFFIKTKCYRDMADKMGIKYLQSLLNKQLKYHIKEKLPNIRENLYQNLTKLKLELGTYEELYDDTDSGRIGFIIQLVNKFVEHFKISLLGYNENINLDSVSIGSQINKALYDEVITKMKIDVSINEENIIKAIHNNNAIRTGLLLPQLAFECVCKDIIERYKIPLSGAIGSITNLMFQAVELSASLKLTGSEKYEKEDEEFIHLAVSKLCQMSQFLNLQNYYEDEQINKLGELAHSYLQVVEMNIEDIIVSYAQKSLA